MTHNAQTGDAFARLDDWKNCTDSEAELEAAYQRLINAPTWEEKLERWREWSRLLDQGPLAHLQEVA